MSFTLSNTFNSNETTYKLWLTRYFQFTFKTILKLTLISRQNIISFRLSVLSLLIHLRNETEKLFGALPWLRMFMDSRRQDSRSRSAQLADMALGLRNWNKSS